MKYKKLLSSLTFITSLPFICASCVDSSKSKSNNGSDEKQDTIPQNPQQNEDKNSNSNKSHDNNGQNPQQNEDKNGNSNKSHDNNAQNSQENEDKNKVTPPPIMITKMAL
ncbi:hypothetical protein E1I18_01290 [Mycoplasmopsis mucosicanis]|uniref:Lipoprotein n=1 Tax=Mycoplasmopsis mucosicanis TaxID=458208 RepID=A0A507SQ51_9BACT|nr:variable surface lipoprotein [Mycoplasmopsis mucosicanis]TQC53949.1 hypothetical protein E1I18_01290 [Mycoplasmopsis mucosicanis]